MDRKIYIFSSIYPALATISITLLALSPTAHATYDPVGSGTTRLTLDRGFISFLKKDGIKLLPAAGATKKGSSFLLPVIEGNLDTTIGKGEIDQGERSSSRAPARRSTSRRSSCGPSRHR